MIEAKPKASTPRQMRITEEPIFAPDASDLERKFQLPRPILEYRYRTSTGMYEVRVRRKKKASEEGWSQLKDFSGQTYRELRDYIVDNLGPVLLATRDVE